ncbi:hypothetical protein PIB30_027891, partial [Stylosanthes scabra]|nr:hypothetical protein [Stylosanthes scabra]
HLRQPSPHPYQRGQCLLRKISIDATAQQRTWCNLSEKLIDAEPLNAGLKGMHYIDLHPLHCILNPVKISSVTEP